MIFNLAQVFLALVIFFTIKLSIYKMTEVWGLPEFLNYPPYSCQKCAQAWGLTSIYLVSGLICHLWITMGLGILLTALDTIAFIKNEKNKFININDEK